MSAINDLILQIQDPALRDRIQKEVDKLSKQKKFGLVFEDHLPECTPLYDMPIKRGCNVALRSNKEDKSIYVVKKIDGNKAICVKRDGDEEKREFLISDIVMVAEFGESIYPYLKPIDNVCNAPDIDLWHTLIEADNYHALQLLEYLYAGKVDCIYIDPPYNTGARDWKYNNDYVDGADSYRHSKWLSFMQRRLRIAKKLLNPKESVLIVTIDEKEYLHLGCLLEELFPSSTIQMISCQINPAPVARKNQFGRTDEYLFYVFVGDAGPEPLCLSNEWLNGVKNTTKYKLHWNSLLRTGTNNTRTHSPGCFYPIFVSEDGKQIIRAGEPLPQGVDRNSIITQSGEKAIWPIHTDGSEGCWQCSPQNLISLKEQGFVRLGGFTPRGMAISYLKRGEQNKVKEGLFPIIGHRDDGSIIVDESGYKPKFVPGTQWTISAHDASRNGTNLIQKILGADRFDFPKSLYSVHDAINFVVANKPEALIIDFFAGSGTTLHAVNLLNAEDGGKRRCIMVTNNEVSVNESKILMSKGYKQGDPEWDELGIARYVTWPRTVCSIKGTDVNGEALKGNYIGNDQAFADGFKANASFWKLSFLDKTAISLGMCFSDMLPLLWLKTGAYGECPSVNNNITDMLILPQNKMAVLNNESAFSEFKACLEQYPEIQTVYLATDYEVNYRSMVKNLNVTTTYQLYRDYLDHFRINNGRS